MQRFGTIRIRAAIELPMGIPITHDKSIKAHLPLQDIGQQSLVTRQFFALPRREAGHHRLYTTPASNAGGYPAP